jgi:hypothetical protein
VTSRPSTFNFRLSTDRGRDGPKTQQRRGSQIHASTRGRTGRMRGWVVIAAAVGMLSMTSVAAAQDKAPTNKSDKMESWEFPDDKLLSVTGGNSEMKIMAGPRIVRTILTKPRTQFIPELLKTIEGL